MAITEEERGPEGADWSESRAAALSEVGKAADDLGRIKLFFWIQVFFLPVSALAGGFHFKVWSMLDTALLIQSVGMTGLAAVLEPGRLRRTVFALAVVLYVAAVIDMGINVVASGVLGWQKMPS